MLGVLPDETNAPDGTFGPGTGGLSVSPGSLWHVPNHRRPHGMGRGATGPVRDWIFMIDDGGLRATSLSTRLDPVNPIRHAFVEPIRILKLSEYNAVLVTTQ